MAALGPVGDDDAAPRRSTSGVASRDLLECRLAREASQRPASDRSRYTVHDEEPTHAAASAHRCAGGKVCRHSDAQFQQRLLPGIVSPTASLADARGEVVSGGLVGELGERVDERLEDVERGLAEAVATGVPVTSSSSTYADASTGASFASSAGRGVV